MFSLDSLDISLYYNIFNFMLTNKVCQKNANLCKSQILADFMNSWQKLQMPAKFYENTMKNKILRKFFIFWK